MKNLTDDHRTRLAGYDETSRILALKTWRAQGFDVSDYQDILPAPKPAPEKVAGAKRPKTPVLTKPCKCEVSNVGTLLKKSLEWTGIPTCQRCSALANELNTLTPDEVLQKADHYAAKLLENMKALSRGEAEGLTWWQTKSAKVKANVALAVIGEESALAYARSYIVKACESAVCCRPFVEGDKPVDDPAGNLPVLGGNVVGEGGRVEEVPEQPDGEPHRRVDGEVEAKVDDPADETHGAGPGDGFGPIHNAALSLSDHGNFVNPEEKLMSPAPPETDSAGLLPSPVSPGASDCEVTE